MAALDTLLQRLTAPAPRLAPTTISFKQASQISGLSESHLRFLASERGEHKLQTVKVGRRRLIESTSLENLLKS